MNKLDLFKIRWIKKVDSTNNYVKKLISLNKIENMTIISAYEQTNGRGQKQNKWYSEPKKNLTFTIYLQHKISSSNLFLLNKFTACVLIDFFKTIDTKNSYFIKWPNDIFVNNKKIAGILIETIIENKTIHCIIGIGINVNQMIFPATIFATSLRILNGNYLSIKQLLNKFAIIFLDKSNLLFSNSYNIRLEYDQNLYLCGIFMRHLVNNNIITGCIRGVDDSGRLIIEREDKTFLLLDHGQWQPIND